MSSKPLPSALEPYLRLPPEASLILLTSTLGCSVNWLTARFMSSALSTENRNTAILLVSWMRDLPYWANELRRSSGLEVTKLQASGQFAFVDCFNNLLIPVKEIQRIIQQTIAELKSSSSRKVLLILDNPDILLATSSTTAYDLSTFILSIRSEQSTHATILSVSADLPNVSAAALETRIPIEAESAAFTIGQAHVSRWLLGVRELETGAAKDVSGVLRITRGGEAYDLIQDEHGAVAKEAELLYLVQRDGNVKVFGRGVDAS